MTYQTGTVTSPTNLKATIEAFATANGYSLSGAGFLSKGTDFAKLTVPSSSTTTMTITGATDSTGTNPTTPDKGIYIDAILWPITYHLFYNSSPDSLVCFLVYNFDYIQYIVISSLVKVNSSAFGGGNFVYASRSSTSLVPVETGGCSLSDSAIDYWGADASVLFARRTSISSAGNTPIYLDINAYGWNGTNPCKVTIAEASCSMLFRSPNVWNGQTPLVPINVKFAVESNLWMYLGYVEHIRLVRLDYYNSTDIITIGPDNWMVFPAHYKDVINRNGSTVNLRNTGTVGLAVRKT